MALPPPLLTFIHISDTHLHVNPAYTGDLVKFSSRPVVAALIDTLNALPFPIDFVLHTGDLMTDPAQDQDYQVARDILSRLRYPVYYLPGNHDRSSGVQQIMMPGQPLAPGGRLYYTFEVNRVQVIALDSSISDSAAGFITDEQLAWLDGLVTADDSRPLVVGVHHHPLKLGAPWLDDIPLLNGDRLHELLLKAKHRLRCVLYGHIHEQTMTLRDGITYISGLSSWFQTRTHYGQTAPAQDPVQMSGYNVVTLTETDTFVRAYRLAFDPLTGR